MVPKMEPRKRGTVCPAMRAARSTRRRLLRSTIILTLVALGMTGVAAAAGFRGVEWGASKEEVLATEKHQLHHELEDEIAYWNFEFAGIEAGLVYTFEEGKLVRAHYLSRHRTSHPSEDLADYRTFQRQLDEHFGEHVAEAWTWADGDEHGESEQTVEALASGAARLESYWKLEGSRVRLLIAGENGKIETVRAIFEPE